MKITRLQFFRLCGELDKSYRDFERVARPLDVYPEHAQTPVYELADPDTGTIPVHNIFLKIETDSGAYGVYGPIFEEVMPLIQGLEDFLCGQDPMQTELLWDKLFRLNRHGRTGYYLLALSAVDCALWDLKGKVLGMPVHRLLGGGRSVPAYASTLGYSLELSDVLEIAEKLKSKGYTAQKWFFRYGPADGRKGMEKNLELAYALREACGNGYGLMFDAWMGWTVPYAREMMRELEGMSPMWLEEPLRPADREGYKNLRRHSNIPLALGEHLYTRWEIKGFLDDGTADYIQADPCWTGGITELKKIGDLCELYGVPLLPHGCATPAGTAVCSSLSPAVAPFMEFLIPYQERQQLFQKYRIFPKNGTLYLPEVPGLTLEYDEKLVKKKKVFQKGKWQKAKKND